MIYPTNTNKLSMMKYNTIFQNALKENLIKYKIKDDEFTFPETHETKNTVLIVDQLINVNFKMMTTNTNEYFKIISILMSVLNKNDLSISASMSDVFNINNKLNNFVMIDNVKKILPKLKYIISSIYLILHDKDIIFSFMELDDKSSVFVLLDRRGISLDQLKNLQVYYKERTIFLKNTYPDVYSEIK